jgi:hypothetical protein
LHAQQQPIHFEAGIANTVRGLHHALEQRRIEGLHGRGVVPAIGGLAALEDAEHGVDRGGLVRKVGVELELHPRCFWRVSKKT